MEFFTNKKFIPLVLFAGSILAGHAQDTTATSSAKLFGGRAQYRTWSFGLNAGVMAPIAAIGGSNDFTNWDVNFGYGATIRKQIGHSFGIEFGFVRGEVSGDNADAPGGVAFNRQSYSTKIDYAASIMGVVNVATIDFLRRENAVSFIVKAGYGTSGYDWVTIDAAGVRDIGATYGTSLPFGTRNNVDIHEQFIPVGVGAKFKLSNRLNLDLGYTMYFVDGDNFDGTYAKRYTQDRWSYGYGGLEYSIGKASKPNLDWVNPVALMYDELKDPALRQEVEALKSRMTMLETTIAMLGQDSDGDGVADKFDKCPATPAGIAVDGSGCPIIHPEPVIRTSTQTSYGNILFEFDSSVLKASAYPILDKIAADMKSAVIGSVQVSGYASSEGTNEYNMVLSRNRANSVKTYLVNSGVQASRISVKFFGEANPVASNATEEGRIQNRRAEFLITKK